MAYINDNISSAQSPNAEASEELKEQVANLTYRILSNPSKMELIALEEEMDSIDWSEFQELKKALDATIEDIYKGWR